MDFPVSISFGDKQLLLHSIIEPIAFFAGFRYFLFLKKKKSDIIESNNRFWIIAAAIFGALLGSRLLGGLENPQPLMDGANWLRHFFINKTILGGLLGGLFSVEMVKKMMGIKVATGDLFVYPLILAMIIGRIGCFTMGIHEQTFGTPTSLFTGMDLGDGLSRHPVTLYEIAYLLVLWIFLIQLSKRFRLANGALFKLFMISYILFRFLLDFIKPSYVYVAGLSAIQLACIAGLVWYLPYLLHPGKLLESPKSNYA